MCAKSSISYDTARIPTYGCSRIVQLVIGVKNKTESSYRWPFFRACRPHVGHWSFDTVVVGTALARCNWKAFSSMKVFWQQPHMFAAYFFFKPIVAQSVAHWWPINAFLDLKCLPQQHLFLATDLFVRIFFTTVFFVLIFFWFMRYWMRLFL